MVLVEAAPAGPGVAMEAGTLVSALVPRGLASYPDENVELALLASSSVDRGSIGVALLTLAGKDTDAGRGSPSDFADAVERLGGKVRIVRAKRRFSGVAIERASA